MIASLRGTVQAVSAAANSHLVLDVGGVGYLVFVTPALARSVHLGQEVSVSTALIVREDAFILFGFESAEQLELFDLLRSVNGVGPKSALSILATMTVDQISQAVQTEDDASFKAVSGIGPKTAKLITVTLAGKLAGFAATGTASAPAKSSRNDLANVIDALIGLGWQERIATDAVRETAAELGDTASTDLLLRSALTRLAARKSVSGGDR